MELLGTNGSTPGPAMSRALASLNSSASSPSAGAGTGAASGNLLPKVPAYSRMSRGAANSQAAMQAALAALTSIKGGLL